MFHFHDVSCGEPRGNCKTVVPLRDSRFSLRSSTGSDNPKTPGSVQVSPHMDACVQSLKVFISTWTLQVLMDPCIHSHLSILLCPPGSEVLVCFVWITSMLVSVGQLWGAWRRDVGSDPRQQGWSVNSLAWQCSSNPLKSFHNFAPSWFVWLWCRCNAFGWGLMLTVKIIIRICVTCRRVCGWGDQRLSEARGSPGCLGWNLSAGFKPVELQSLLITPKANIYTSASKPATHSFICFIIFSRSLCTPLTLGFIFTWIVWNQNATHLSKNQDEICSSRLI